MISEWIDFEQQQINGNCVLQVSIFSSHTSGVSLFYRTERNRTECSVALFSRTEQLFNISLHENSSCLGL